MNPNSENKQPDFLSILILVAVAEGPLGLFFAAAWYITSRIINGDGSVFGLVALLKTYGVVASRRRGCEPGL